MSYIMSTEGVTNLFKLLPDPPTMAKITIRVDDEQKQRWEDAQENEPRSSNMTNFVKLAVEDYIARNDLE